MANNDEVNTQAEERNLSQHLEDGQVLDREASHEETENDNSSMCSQELSQTKRLTSSQKLASFAFAPS